MKNKIGKLGIVKIKNHSSFQRQYHKSEKTIQVITIFSFTHKELLLPLDCKVKKAFTYADKQPVKFKKTKEGVKLMFNEVPAGTDYIVELITK